MSGRWVVTAIEYDECCSYIAVMEYDSYDAIPKLFLSDDNYLVEFEDGDEADWDDLSDMVVRG